jgi:phosphatidylglycerophosphatase A
LDKTKPGIIGKLDGKKEGVVSTFIDDIVCAIVAAAASRLAHSN